jgi:hypothetical protein
VRGARGGEAGRGGESGGNAAERRDDAAARQGSSGEVARATGCTGSTTNSMGVLLTSRCSSLAASQRRNDSGGKESKAAVALNSPDGFLGVQATCGGTCSGRTRGRWRRSPGRRQRWVDPVGQPQRAEAALGWRCWASWATQS